LARCNSANSEDLVWPPASSRGGEGERVAAKEAGFGSGFGFDPLPVQWLEVIKKDSRFALFTQLIHCFI
jgi:hypothetical protein